MMYEKLWHESEFNMTFTLAVASFSVVDGDELSEAYAAVLKDWGGQATLFN